MSNPDKINPEEVEVETPEEVEDSKPEEEEETTPEEESEEDAPKTLGLPAPYNDLIELPEIVPLTKELLGGKPKNTKRKKVTWNEWKKIKIAAIVERYEAVHLDHMVNGEPGKPLTRTAILRKIGVNIDKLTKRELHGWRICVHRADKLIAEKQSEMLLEAEKES